MVKEVNLSEYVPDYYEGVKDMKELVRVENALFKDGTVSRTSLLCIVTFLP